ncbi:MAG: glycosyltransferase family 2 protein [Candidatus Altiarchaeota archaeon]|nr:glycosyltransferase family 2 protein [Candidatus Altiarchaeota archaeon]
MDFKLSVILPSYKEDAYIEDTLEALRAQDYRNIEIIVVDSSPDGKTREVAGKYADKVMYLPERGVSKARNLGASSATGDIFVFIDADTLSKKDSLVEIAKAFEKDRKVIAVCGYVEVDSNIVNKILYKFASESVWLLAKLGNPLFYGFCVAYRKDAFRKFGGFSENYVTCEDLDTSRRAVKYGKCILARKARFITSARRIEKGGLNMILFHAKNLMNYTIRGKAEEFYPVIR